MPGEDYTNIGGINFLSSQIRNSCTNGHGAYVVETDDGSVFTFNEQSQKQRVNNPTIYRDYEGKTNIQSCILEYLKDSPKKDFYVLSDTDVNGGGSLGKDDKILIFNEPKHAPNEPAPMNRNFFVRHN